ncbi:MAG: hypothetical protein L6Q35_01305 [Phycisphaerales bacterium]|nr:hypothetical protein [Phycisphaerales bacterium]
MPKFDCAAVAVNAAGIADAFACVQLDATMRAARFECVAVKYGGHVGIMQQLAEAAAVMERFRANRGVSATWGGELPHLYEVWDSIAEVMWTRLGTEPLDQLVESAIQIAMSVETA